MFYPDYGSYRVSHIEASFCYFFENWLQISKCHNLRDLKNTIYAWNHQYWCLLEPIYFIHFNVRHPVHMLDCLWKDRKFRWFCLYGQLFIGPVEVLWLKGAYLQEKNLLCSNIDQSQRAMQEVLGSQTKAIQECVDFRLGLIRDLDKMNRINTK